MKKQKPQYFISMGITANTVIGDNIHVATLWFGVVHNDFSQGGTLASPIIRPIHSRDTNHPYYNLRALSYLTDQDAAGAYGTTYHYANVHEIDTARAKVMLATLRWIDKKMKSHREWYGYEKSLGEFIYRFAWSVGAEGLIDWDKSDAGRNKNIYARFDLDQLVAVVDSAVSDWHAAHPQIKSA
jgi:hypothetical protein